MITNDRELWDASQRAGKLLQEIQEYIERSGREARQNVRHSAVRFPRGFIRTAEMGRLYFKFVRCPQLRSNLAYTMMLSDAVHWLLVRTDVYGTAREMLIKLQMFLGASMVESITSNFLKGRCGGKYLPRLDYLKAHGFISVELKDDLEWLWKMRSKMHLFQVTSSEYFSADYSVVNLNRAVMAVRNLCGCLSGEG